MAPHLQSNPNSGHVLQGAEIINSPSETVFAVSICPGLWAAQVRTGAWKRQGGGGQGGGRKGFWSGACTAPACTPTPLFRCYLALISLLFCKQVLTDIQYQYQRIAGVQSIHTLTPKMHFGEGFQWRESRRVLYLREDCIFTVQHYNVRHTADQNPVPPPCTTPDWLQRAEGEKSLFQLVSI